MPTQTDNFQDLIPKPKTQPENQYNFQAGDRGYAGPGGSTPHADQAAMVETSAPTPPAGAGDQLFGGQQDTEQSIDTLQQFGAEASPVTSEQTVSGQLDKILNKDNALFDVARGKAMQFASSRGLQNSTMAAQAGEQAVLETALPIAQQDAATYAQRAQQEAGFYQSGGLQAMEATIQANLSAQDHLQNMVELSQQGDINSQLQLEQFGYNTELSVQDNLHQMQQLALQGDINSQLALQAFGFDTELMAQDFGYRVSLANKELENALALSAQDHTQWLQRISAGHVNTLAEIEATGDVNSQLQQEGFLQSAELQRQQIAGQLQSTLATIAAGAAEDRELQAQRARDEAALQTARIDQTLAADLERLGAQSHLDTATYSRGLQQNYLLATERRTLQFSSEIQSIYQREGLTPAQQANAVSVARRNMENDLAMLASYYTASPYWDPNFGTSTPNTGGGTNYDFIYDNPVDIGGGNPINTYNGGGNNYNGNYQIP